MSKDENQSPKSNVGTKGSRKSTASAQVRALEDPPAQLPAVFLDDLVPFPGTMVPLLLNSPQRREAVYQAKNDSGMLLLVNRRDVKRRPDPSEMVVTDLRVLDGDGASATGMGTDQATTAEGLLEIAVAMESGGRNGMSAEDTDVDISELLTGADDAPRRKKNAAKGKKKKVAVEKLHIDAISRVGIIARLVKVVRLPDDRLSALVQLVRRAQPLEVMASAPCPVLKVMYPTEVIGDVPAFEANYRQVKLTLQAFFEAHPTVSEEVKLAALSMEVPGSLADFVAQHLSRDFDERLAFLNELDVSKRMRLALEVTIRELDLLTVGNRISQEIRDKVEKHQRDFLLREQLKSIRSELGEEKDPATVAIAGLQAKLEKANLPPVARARADEELRRLQLLSTESPEHNVVRSYIEWIADLPWSKTSDDLQDIARARQILDEDHYGLEEVKDRIVEFLAVHQLNPKKTGTLMCFSGPPGVGKTSLGQSIARALGREFYRLSVGGMRDEAEIKGHRRTYIGSMPGRILQGLKQVKTANPVFMLDELDKIGSDWRGDPSSALLEVLDPAQNKNFMDNYLDLPFDLSRVMFIATANVHTEMPGPLRDRLEIIELPGYIPEEKLEIAARYLLPRQRKEHGLNRDQLRVSRTALRHLIQQYTHEAGVRELERMVAKICRKRALAVVQEQQQRQHKTPKPKATLPTVEYKELNTYLGPPKIFNDHLLRQLPPGVAIGLAWTAVGGDIMFIEVVRMPGKGQLKVTGQLGEVMTESAGLAVSYVRDQAKEYGIDPEIFSKYDLHLHFPAGAVRKDGPSAGITITTALISLLTQTSIKPKIAMTGEMTLRGDVLPIGGLREKVVAARRAGIQVVIVPERNRSDVEDIPPVVRDKIRFVYAAHYKDVFREALKPQRKKGKKQ